MTGDLAFVADALLAMCEQEERTYFIGEAYEKKIQHERRRQSDLAKMHLEASRDPLLKNECLEVIQKAKLTERQADILVLRLEGHTFEDIGRKRRASKQCIQNSFVQALKKIRQSFTVYPYRGLSEVYRREVRRGGRRGAFGTMHR